MCTGWCTIELTIHSIWTFERVRKLPPYNPLSNFLVSGSTNRNASQHCITVMHGHKDGTFINAHMCNATTHMVEEQLGMKRIKTGICALARLGGGASRQP